MEVSQTKPNGKTSVQKRIANLNRGNRRFRQKLAIEKRALEICNEKLQQALSQIRQLEIEIEFHKQQLSQVDHASASVAPPFSDPNVFDHRYSASMVALCVNLANVVPLRAVSKTLETVLNALNISTLIPDRETITRWLKRLGIDKLKQNQCLDRWKDKKDVIWIVDHSNQIGTQKALVILAIPASELPPEGQTLSLDALEVLLIEPSDSWNRDDMRRVYRELADVVGCPRFVLCDGAVELRETVDVLGDDDREVIVLRDFKHFAANRFESMIGRSESFLEFAAEMGKTRCRIQQTDLAHLNPPALKTKSRFMNIEPVISWAQMVLGVLSDPESEEAGVRDVEKLRDRLGWLEDFRDDIASWRRCCEVISSSLAWVNAHGLCQRSGEILQTHLDQCREERCELSDQLSSKLVEHVKCSASMLEPGERTWLSTEALESAFGLLKRREGQQCRSGFTGLIATLPTLLRTWPAAEVRVALQRTSTKEAQEWIKDKIGLTLWAKRAQAFKHFGAAKCQFFATR